METGTFDLMRDCVKNAFEKGVKKGEEFRKFRHAIIFELKRQGFEPHRIKELLREWNKRNEKRLTEAKIRSQLCAYVDWFFKKDDRKLSCKALADYCEDKFSCRFHNNNREAGNLKGREAQKVINDIEKYLKDRYRKKNLGVRLFYIVNTLKIFQLEKGMPEIIYIGFQNISERIFDNEKCRMESKEVYRLIQILKEDGILEQVETGKKGTFGHVPANGYRITYRPET